VVACTVHGSCGSKSGRQKPEGMPVAEGADDLPLGGGVRAHKDGDKGDESRMTDFILVHVACYILTKGVKVKVRQMLFAIAECLVQVLCKELQSILSFLEPLDTATARLVAFFLFL
jgi:hypothetical protein